MKRADASLRSVTDDTSLTLTHHWVGSLGLVAPAYRLMMAEEFTHRRQS